MPLGGAFCSNGSMAKASMDSILPLHGLRRAGLISRTLLAALRDLGVEDLVQLCAWTRGELRAQAGLSPDGLAELEALMARYCLDLKPERRRRFRRPGHRLDPY